MTTPFATLGIRCTEEAVTEIDFLSRAIPSRVPSNGLAQAVWRAIEHYLRHPHYDFELPLAVAGTPFQCRVWDELRRIPAGQVITYAELARRVGSGARAVANACGANPVPVIIPCHRVVAANGLGGFMRGRMDSSLDIKRWLLTHERSAPSAA